MDGWRERDSSMLAMTVSMCSGQVTKSYFHFICFCWKKIDMLEGQINDLPYQERYWHIAHFHTFNTLNLSWSPTLEGVFELTRRPSRAHSNTPNTLLSYLLKFVGLRFTLGMCCHEKTTQWRRRPPATTLIVFNTLKVLFNLNSQGRLWSYFGWGLASKEQQLYFFTIQALFKDGFLLPISSQVGKP